MWCQQKQSVTDGQTDRQTTDKVISLWCFALQVAQKLCPPPLHFDLLN